MINPLEILTISLIPMGAALLGGILASIIRLNHQIVSSLQHFVAGIVIAAVSIELLPEILDKHAFFSVGIGFLFGVFLMFLLHELSHFFAHNREGFPLGLVVASALDLLIDGLLIGVAFLVGRESGILIAISLSLCAFFLNLTVASTMRIRKKKSWTLWSALVLIAVALPIGAYLGSTLMLHLPETFLVGTVSFGVAALLYLGIEELLVEAHQTQDSAWISLPFFIGFLLILLFKV